MPTSVCLSDCLFLDANGKLSIRTDNATIKCVPDGAGGSMLQAVGVKSTGGTNAVAIDPAGGLQYNANGLGIKLNGFSGCNDLEVGTDGLLMRYIMNQFSVKSSGTATWYGNIPGFSSSEKFYPPELAASVNFRTPSCGSNTIVFAIATFGAIEWSFTSDNEPLFFDIFRMTANGTVIENEYQQTNIDSRGISGAYYQGTNAKMVHVISRVIPPNTDVQLIADTYVTRDVDGVINAGIPNYLIHRPNKIDVITFLDDKND